MQNTICESNFACKRSFLELYDTDGRPERRPQLPNMLRFVAIFCAFPFSIPPHSLPILLPSPISLYPSLRRWTRNLAITDITCLTYKSTLILLSHTLLNSSTNVHETKCTTTSIKQIYDETILTVKTRLQIKQAPVNRIHCFWGYRGLVQFFFIVRE